MATTYRKKNQVSSQSGLLGSVMLIGVSFLSGYLAASFLDIKHLGSWLLSLRPEISQLVSAPQLANHTQKPKLEFYTLLTANHGAVLPPPPPVAVVAPAPVVAVTQSTHSPNTQQRVAYVNSESTLLAREIKTEVKLAAQNPITTKQQGYTIQVAALRSLHDAEHMKASLLLRGFSANVSSVASHGVTWFRVMIGPFASRAQAEKTQSVLARRERMNGMIRKMDA